MATNQQPRGTTTNPVDADKLWCDRIRNETLSAKNWSQAYEYLVSGNVQSNEEKQAQLEATLGVSSMTYRGMKSEHQASFQQRPNLERFGKSEFSHKVAKWNGGASNVV
eukprot:TRINITY_DN59818_c0_g1_i1.p1 TRINITY_DN59818_c0_g1~~TRINITY_DN59818_c0_g1_i1.p1  ORF type:complete len:109 (-),score=4.54 TRINITY_DN59818_c0_g1_i1:264-590(-)